MTAGPPEHDPFLADVQGSVRRISAGLGLSGNAELYGDICATCDARWALSADRASCPHKPICEDCFPNGCEVCEWEVHEAEMRREQLTERIAAAALELRTHADDLSETDLRSLDWRVRGDVIRNTELTIEALRRVHDTLSALERKRSSPL